MDEDSNKRYSDQVWLKQREITILLKQYNLLMLQKDMAPNGTPFIYNIHR